jgi:LPPG:FO 2-phospho-L-lactate transferase
MQNTFQPPSRVVVLSGGMGGAKFLQGLKHLLPDSRITVVANTCDDMWVHGLRVCPDLDTVMYTLGDGIDRERGWGRTDETWSTKEDLAAYGAGLEWFGLGDRDIATHLVRTTMLRAGATLTEVTARLCDRWQPGVELLPMTDDEVETHVVIDDGGGRRTIHSQEYWVRLRAELPALELIFRGLESSRPTPRVLQAIAEADLVVLPPSNPVVSVGTILGVPGLREAIRATTAPVVGLSPIVGGTHVRGMAEQMLASIGVGVSAEAVGLHYGARSAGGVLDGWLVDTVDAAGVAELEAAGIRAIAVPLMMTDLGATAAMARAAIDLVR